MNARYIVSAALIILCLAAPAAASAATRYAEPGGDGPEATCPQADPCDISVAVESTQAHNGDEVVILPGTYNFGSTGDDTLYLTKALDVHGQAGQPMPVLNTTALFGVYSNNAGARLSRVRVAQSGSFAGVYFWAGTVERVVAHSTSAGGPACSGQSAVIRDTVCWAEGDHAAGIGISQSGATWTMKLRNVTAVGEGNLSNAAGITLYSSTGADHTIDAKGVIADSPGGDILVTADASSKATVNLDHSSYTNAFLFGPGNRSVTAPGSGSNQTAAPKFVDAAAGDFREAADSPTIDAGALDASSGLLDLDDAPRTDGLGPDIGAYELADGDDDDDGIPDTNDNCGLVANQDQLDTDADAEGDACDADDDNDGTADGTDNCRLIVNPTQLNSDADGQGDACDADDDNDGVEDAADNCPLAANADQADVDTDGRGDACDPTDDRPVPPPGETPPPAQTPGETPPGGSTPPEEQAPPADNDSEPTDRLAPDTIIDTAPAKGHQKRTVELTFHATEPGARFECKLDRRAFAPCTSPLRVRASAGRRHRVRVRAIDAAGNVDPTPAVVGWRVRAR